MVRTLPLGGSRLAFVPALILSLAMGVAFEAAAQLEDIVDERVSGNKSSTKSQTKVDTLSDQTDSLLSEYKVVLQQIDALRVYNHQVEVLIDAQSREITSLEEQIDGVELVGRQITPLMLQMISGVEEFVELDLPFLLTERRERVATLREIMDRADISDAERYRRIMEAYQIENDFGRTIEAYRADLELGGVTRSMDFLRFGRIALLYQTQDGTETGVWDQKAKKWTELPGEYRAPVRQGLRIALKQVAPDMLQLPIPAAEDAK